MSAAPKVAVLAVGDPESEATWSGTTAGVLGGLRSLGVDARGVNLELPRGIEQAALIAAAARTRNRYDAQAAALAHALRSGLARRRLGGRGYEGAVQVGTTFALPRDVPFVTLEDMTVRQGVAVHPVFSRMTPSTVDAWERRRAAIYARARACGAASHWTARSLEDDYGVPAERIAVVGLGANHRFDPPAPARRWHPARFLFVGVDWERKGGPLLLRAFARVHERHPDATLDLAGGHPDVHQRGVTGHGMLSRASQADRALISDLFARATCFVMPSEVEPFGIVHIEAASAGIASIATSAGGPADVVGADGGLLVAPGEEEELVQAMLCLAEPVVAERMGAAARARSELYTWERVAERLVGALGLAAPDGRALAALL